jgi:hypothetical protein
VRHALSAPSLFQFLQRNRKTPRFALAIAADDIVCLGLRASFGQCKYHSVRTAGKLGQRSVGNCDKCFSIYAADIDFDPIIALAVEHEGAVGWRAGTLHRRARLAIFEIPNDVDIVNFEVLACQDGDGREQAWKDALHAL